MILLTHGHFDHIGACEELAVETGAEVYVNEKDNQLLSDYDKNGKLLTKSDPQSGIELHRLMLSPYGIVMADGFYYLLANDVRYDDLRHLDRQDTKG